MLNNYYLGLTLFLCLILLVAQSSNSIFGDDDFTAKFSQKEIEHVCGQEYKSNNYKIVIFNERFNLLSLKKEPNKIQVVCSLFNKKSIAHNPRLLIRKAMESHRLDVATKFYSHWNINSDFSLSEQITSAASQKIKKYIGSILIDVNGSPFILNSNTFAPVSECQSNNLKRFMLQSSDDYPIKLFNYYGFFITNTQSINKFKITSKELGNDITKTLKCIDRKVNLSAIASWKNKN